MIITSNHLQSWIFIDGITAYEKKDTILGQRSIKIGCDYGHSWDRDIGYHYDLAEVRRDAERSIDRLHELFPNLLVRCGWDGGFYPRDEMVEVHPGQLYHKFNTSEERAKREAAGA